MKRAITLLLLVILLAAAPLALAQGHNFTLNWWTVDGGGGTSGNGRYTLQATIGQPDAGEMGDGRYTLVAGYWGGPGQHRVYLPLVVRP